MILLGFEIIGLAIIFYGLKEIFSCKENNNINNNTIHTINNNDYQPLPKYEDIIQEDNNIMNSNVSDNPPAYNDI